MDKEQNQDKMITEYEYKRKFPFEIVKYAELIKLINEEARKISRVPDDQDPYPLR